MLVVNGAGATEWALDQALRSSPASAVLGWANPRDPHACDGMQLAAEASRSLAGAVSPAAGGAHAFAGRVAARAARGGTEGLQVRIVKSRGGRPATVNLGR